MRLLWTWPVVAGIRSASKKLHPKFLYKDKGQIFTIKKLRHVVTSVYGAERVLRKTRILGRSGFGQMLVCIARTHWSISLDPKVKGVPNGYIL